jgi:hypothetical protein
LEQAAREAEPAAAKDARLRDAARNSFAVSVDLRKRDGLLRPICESFNADPFVYSQQLSGPEDRLDYANLKVDREPYCSTL